MTNRGWAHHGWPPRPQPIVFTRITRSPLAYGLIFSQLYQLCHLGYGRCAGCACLCVAEIWLRSQLWMATRTLGESGSIRGTKYREILRGDLAAAATSHVDDMPFLMNTPVQLPPAFESWLQRWRHPLRRLIIASQIVVQAGIVNGLLGCDQR